MAGADSGLILGCCKILQKTLNIEMMYYAKKLKIHQEARRYSFDYNKGADLKVIFNSSNKHPLYTFLALSELVLDHAKVKILLILLHFLVVFLVYLICQFIDTLMFWYIKGAQVMQICVKIQFIISRPRFIYVISGPRFIYA